MSAVLNDVHVLTRPFDEPHDELLVRLSRTGISVVVGSPDSDIGQELIAIVLHSIGKGLESRWLYHVQLLDLHIVLHSGCLHKMDS
jgi:hypothetical protein